jgi:hypothetical protein
MDVLRQSGCPITAPGETSRPSLMEKRGRMAAEVRQKRSPHTDGTSSGPALCCFRCLRARTQSVANCDMGGSITGGFRQALFSVEVVIDETSRA